MKKEGYEYLFNEAVRYLGKYPATKKKIEEYLKKKLRNKNTYQKATFSENIEKDTLVKDIVSKLDELKIINESNYLESMFNYYQQSLFSIRKIKNKLYQKGFDEKKCRRIFVSRGNKILREISSNQKENRTISSKKAKR